MTRPARRTRIADASSMWVLLAKKLRPDSHVVIFLDFDGTLVDIAPRPDLVRLRPQARKGLERLARLPRATVVMISGRRREELLHHVHIRGIHYFGLYGWQRAASCKLPANISAALRRARIQLSRHLGDYPQAWIENKRSGLSIHLLHVTKPEQSQIRRQIRTWLRPFGKSLRCSENIRDIDVLPRSLPGKGAAVRQFLAQRKFRRALPLYFGDDFSDESAFVAVRRGFSIHVGKRRATRARFNVRRPADVAAALTKLAALLSGQ